MIPRWLQIFVGGRIFDHFTGTHIYMATAELLSTRRHPGESIVFGHVCQICNGGWMNTLEVSVARLLKDVITNGGSANTWGREDCELVARWTFKTAAMINAGSNYRRIIPPQHLHDFYEREQLPRGTGVDVGLSSPPAVPTIEWRQSQNFPIFNPPGSPEESGLALLQSYRVTLWLGQLLVKVMYWPDPSGVPLGWGVDSVRIWPYSEAVAFDKISALSASDTTIDEFDFGYVVYPGQGLAG
jgi:hypothetical protein